MPYLIAIIAVIFVISRVVEALQQNAREQKKKRQEEFRSNNAAQPRQADDEEQEEEDTFEASFGQVQDFLQQTARKSRRGDRQRQQQPEQRPQPASPTMGGERQFVSQTVNQQATSGVDQQATSGANQHAAMGFSAQPSQPRSQAARQTKLRAPAGKARTQFVRAVPVGAPDNPFDRPAIRRLTPTQRAIIMMDILGAPGGLRDKEARWS